MKFLRVILGALFWVLSLQSATAHALDPGYLELRQLDQDIWQVFWRKPDVTGSPMAIDVVLPDACSVPDGPSPSFDGSAWVSSWITDCAGGLAGREVGISGLSAQRTDVLLNVYATDRPVETLRLTPLEPFKQLAENPTILGVFTSYFALGFEHILEGWDHLLFVFALLLLIHDKWRLVGAVTAFTVAHSVTLALAALGHISIPGPPVEAVIALSIVFLAIEVLKDDEGHMRLSVRFPWVVAFAFGLLHGLGFAGALREIGLPPSEVPTALVAFNLGVEAGQLTFIAFVLICAGALRYVAAHLDWIRMPSRLAVASVLAYPVGFVATFWLVERISGF